MVEGRKADQKGGSKRERTEERLYVKGERKERVSGVCLTN